IPRRNPNNAWKNERQDLDELGVPAASRLKTGSDAGAFVLVTLGVGPVTTSAAIQTWDMVMKRHAVAEPKSSNFRAQSHNRPRGFVPKNPRRRHRAEFYFFQVRGADAARGHLNKQFVCAEARDGNGFEPQ